MNTPTVVNIQPIRYEHLMPAVQKAAQEAGLADEQWYVAHSKEMEFWTFGTDKKTLPATVQEVVFELDEELARPFFIVWKPTEYTPSWISQS